MVFLKLEERRALSQRSPREKVRCPVCGGDAERQRNGDWQCIETEDHHWGTIVTHLRVCNSRGVTIADELVPTSRPKIDEER